MLERALRTGSVLLAAAQADALWSIGCGDAIEDAKQAINRYTSISKVWIAPVDAEQDVCETPFVLAVTLLRLPWRCFVVVVKLVGNEFMIWLVKYRLYCCGVIALYQDVLVAAASTLEHLDSVW